MEEVDGVFEGAEVEGAMEGRMDAVADGNNDSVGTSDGTVDDISVGAIEVDGTGVIVGFIEGDADGS